MGLKQNRLLVNRRIDQLVELRCYRAKTITADITYADANEGSNYRAEMLLAA